MYGPLLAETPFSFQIALANSWLPEHTEPKPFRTPGVSFTPTTQLHFVDYRGPAAPLRIIEAIGPSMPVKMPKRQKNTNGKADPVWDVQFAAKFSKPPEPKFVVPHGYTSPLDAFLGRADEINQIARTAHLELSPLSAQLAANGYSVTRVQGGTRDEYDSVEANLADTHLNTTPYDPDPLTIAATSRLIEWERFKTASGAVARCRWSVTPKGTVGIEYLGPNWDKPEYALEQKREFKRRWLASHEAMPTVEEITNAQAYVAHYGNPAVMYMTDAEFAAFLKARIEGNEDPDEEMRTRLLYADMTRSGWCKDQQCIAARNEDDADPFRHTCEIGYAGPIGALGIDDDESGFDDDEYEGEWG